MLELRTIPTLAISRVTGAYRLAGPRRKLYLGLSLITFLVLFAACCLGWPLWAVPALLAHFLMTVPFLRELGGLEREFETKHIDAIKGIALAMEARDPYTQGHCLRVRRLARRILDQVEVDPVTRAEIELGALLHDVGKLGVPDALLLKQAPLTREEHSRLLLHVDIGVEILTPFLAFHAALELVKHHHERFDGSGYPDGLKGEEIPFGSRVIAVADTIDAMRSNRPYRPALSIEDTKNELRQARGVQLDPRLVDVALRVLSSGPSSDRVVVKEPEAALVAG